MGSIISKLFKYLFNPNFRFIVNANRGFYDSKNDVWYLKRLYKSRTGSQLNLDNPKTFNEKMQWLKINDRKPIYTIMADKYAVKSYVANLIGEKYVIPLLGVYQSFETIDFDSLPDQFVLKTTHDCGSVIVCKNKDGFNIELARHKLEKSLNTNYFLHGREWPYKDIKHQIIAEKYIHDEAHDALLVYKVFCFNGEPFIIQVITGDKTSSESIDYFDLDWNLLDLHQNFPNSLVHLPKPVCLPEMLSLSRKMSHNHSFLRVDWYIVNNQLLFSEFTFYSDNGLEPFYPKEWDFILGSKIILKDINE